MTTRLVCGCECHKENKESCIKCNNHHIPEGVLDVSDDDTWRDCLRCKGRLTQVRKALFTCENCNQEYIAEEQDMRPEGYNG